MLSFTVEQNYSDGSTDARFFQPSVHPTPLWRVGLVCHNRSTRPLSNPNHSRRCHTRPCATVPSASGQSPRTRAFLRHSAGPPCSPPADRASPPCRILCTHRRYCPSLGFGPLGDSDFAPPRELVGDHLRMHRASPPPPQLILVLKSVLWWDFSHFIPSTCTVSIWIRVNWLIASMDCPVIMSSYPLSNLFLMFIIFVLFFLHSFHWFFMD
jgi:hypothetical protein